MSEFISKSFDETLRKFKIPAKHMSEVSGASQSQLSEFRNGKRNLSTAQLERVLIAMDEIAPGSRLHFCMLCAGSISNKQIAVLLNSLADRIETSNSREMAGTVI